MQADLAAWLQNAVRLGQKFAAAGVRDIEGAAELDLVGGTVGCEDFCRQRATELVLPDGFGGTAGRRQLLGRLPGAAGPSKITETRVPGTNRVRPSTSTPLADRFTRRTVSPGESRIPVMAEIASAG